MPINNMLSFFIMVLALLTHELEASTLVWSHDVCFFLGKNVSFLKSLNRYIERNQAASRALHEQYDKPSITDIDDFSAELWVSIDKSSSKQYLLEIFDNEEISLEFMVKIFVKIGFSCEDSVRLMIKTHKKGSVVLAKAEESTLLRLQEYINTQANAHGFCFSNRIRKT